MRPSAPDPFPFIAWNTPDLWNQANAALESSLYRHDRKLEGARRLARSLREMEDAYIQAIR
jgi:hypothetical protein